MKCPHCHKEISKTGVTYYSAEKDGRFYVYYLQVAPIETLFEIVSTQEQAEQAIEDHKSGKHSTQR